MTISTSPSPREHRHHPFAIDENLIERLIYQWRMDSLGIIEHIDCLMCRHDCPAWAYLAISKLELKSWISDLAAYLGSGEEAAALGHFDLPVVCVCVGVSVGVCQSVPDQTS